MYLGPPSEFERRFEPRRPVVLFGTEIEVRRSTALTFSPFVVFYAATGESLKARLESEERPLWNVLRAIARAEASGGKVRHATEKVFERESLRNADFNPLSLQALHDLPESIAAQWRLAFRCRHDLHRVERRMLARLATADRIAHLITATKDPAESKRRREAVFGPGLRYWRSTGLGLPWQCIAPLDTSLLVLAHLEREFGYEMPQLWKPDSISGLIATPTQPIRTWFESLLRLTGSHSYPKLADYLTLRGFSTKGADGVNPGRLAKWANALEPMRADKAAPMLLACGSAVHAGYELRRFFYARLLTFLVEWARACAEEEPPREAVQRAVTGRFLQCRGAA